MTHPYLDSVIFLSSQMKHNILLSFGTFAQEKSSCRKISKAVRQKKICGQKSVAVLDLNIFHFSIRKCGHSCRYVFIYGALNIKQGRHVRVATTMAHGVARKQAK